MAQPIAADKVSVVVPILNAAAHLEALLTALQRQTPLPPSEIILVDSGSTDASLAIAGKFANTRIVPLSNFSHGRSRNLGARAASGEIVVFLSQDALPKDNFWLQELLRPFFDPQTVGTYSRQIPWPDALFAEKFFLATRFPAGPAIRREKPARAELTLEDVFFSNVSSAIRRSTLLRYPFDETLIMSEDQKFSKDVLNAGYAVVYAPDSVVIHSHAYTLLSLFRRYFDSVYSLTQIFPAHGVGTSAAIGSSYIRKEALFVIRACPQKIPYYVCYNLAKAAAGVLAHLAPHLPKFLLRRLSLHSYHWK
ncbi:MAG: glycosyltransferase [Thermodesulfobacteriota bacterium]